MNIQPMSPPRHFSVGAAGDIQIRHCADLELADDEQVTFKTASGTEFDLVRKSWGYYATPSLNGRLPSRGLRPVLVVSPAGKLFLLFVEPACAADFHGYVSREQLGVIAWLDAEENVVRLINWSDENLKVDDRT